MNEQYTIQSTHEALKQKMFDYINTIYLGKNDALRYACAQQLKEQETLYQAPYIEANRAYAVADNGIANLKLPPDRQHLKEALEKLAEQKLGVFPSPYVHQLEAVTAFAQGQDVFVSTGTGSGKTECFMWPLAGKLLEEATKSPNTWSERGVRVMMLYPMNALVSDQIGRLRKLIGDRDEKFHGILQGMAPNARQPQFGMYTGRTPYAGEGNLKRDKKLAETMTKELLLGDKSVQNALIDLGKYPAKKDLMSFVEGLTKGNHITDPRDAELMTRQEMRQSCPDILITNYSMLQYMLIRPIESSLWADTRKWLRASPENKMLFVIDEAHMYRGSSGGEVALLIRRFMHTLGIDRSQIQFILTSASVPKDELSAVRQFASELTGSSTEKTNFSIITGTDEVIESDHSVNLDYRVLSTVSVDSLQGDFSSRVDCVKMIGKELGWDMSSYQFRDEKELGLCLYHCLKNSAPMESIMLECRGNATKFEELAKIAFPEASQEEANIATNALLCLAQLAKKPDGSVFFPTRLHLMFRGLKGISACVNPQCPHAKEHEKEQGLGKIYLGNHHLRCDCGSKVYEVLNDRTCGAIFLKGFMDFHSEEKFVWNQRGGNFEGQLLEVHFYILSQSDSYKKAKDDNFVWMESATGKVFYDDNHSGEDGFLRLVYSTREGKENPVLRTFSSCPKCEKRKLRVTDFVTKGNEPFFNLVSEQFYVQPPTMFTPEEIEATPNAGRKVLVFSDSRQRAAVLAKDLTRAADEYAMKTAMTIATVELGKWAKASNKVVTLDMLFVAFLKVATENKLRFFYGDDEDDLKELLLKMQDQLERIKKKSRAINYESLKSKFQPVPKLFSEQLFKQLCSNFHSLTDLALCLVEASDIDYLEEIEDDLDTADIDLDIEDFKKLFSAWATEIMTDSYALGHDIPDDVRGEVTNHYRFGVEKDKKLSKKFHVLLEEQGYTPEKIDVIYGCLCKFLTKGNDSENYYLNFSSVALSFCEEETWCRCPRCSSLFPHTLWGKCGRCGKGKPVEMSEQDYDRINFWRAPVINALKGDKEALMTRINVEEHTAQLSHKDGQKSMWSTTEDFEMRFQNVYATNDKPVDILSCTTTMEVGIDIGSLTAVALRNIPPMRENYQQRAGRAGRRSSSISTIVTYTDNGPYDSYYFYHPEKIISGEARKPWIDVVNQKLVSRHLNSIIVSNYLKSKNENIDKTSAITFFQQLFDSRELSKHSLTQHDTEILLPEGIEFTEHDMDKLCQDLLTLQKKILDFPDNYKGDDVKDVSVLDVLLEEGIFPTYSFPRNVIGFHVEDKKGSAIEEKPDRSIEMALSEYAPGRIVVINKKSYKSAGIYNFHSKFIPGYYDKPAERYFNSPEHKKTLYFCEHDYCTWMDTTLPSDKICPFCSNVITGEKTLIKPWGFAPAGGKAIPEAKANNELSYATDPCYATPLCEESLNKIGDMENLRYAKLPDQSLNIVNSGNGEGFLVCKLCGAAVQGSDYKDLKEIARPFRHPTSQIPFCKHPEESMAQVFLGHQLLTDMVLFVIELDSNKQDTSSRNIWLHSASQTLAEAMALSAGRLLDIEFTDIKSGYRIRRNGEKVHVDIFLFDNLSSGAGYSSSIADRIKELLIETRETLLSCKNNCETACQECLKHFWNQRNHHIMNRFLAIDLLNWLELGVLPEAIPLEQQMHLLKPLKKILQNKHSLEESNGEILLNGRERVVVYPVMWNRHDERIPSAAISLPDKIVKEALPDAYRIILG